jgi:hypothetical protein
MGRRYAVILSAVFYIVVLAAPVIGAEAGPSDTGIVSEAAQALKERFTLCDEFLDVKWTDKSRMTGILKAEVYRDGKKEMRSVITYLEKPGTRAYNRRGNGIFYEIGSQEFEEAGFQKFLLGASYNFSHENVFMNVTKGKKSGHYPQEPLPFEAFVSHRNDFPNRSFSGFAKTVCVAYPDRNKVFVIEAKKRFIIVPLDENGKKSYEMVVKYAKDQCIAADKKEAGPECNLDSLKDSYAMDLNGDGKADYIFTVAGKQGDKVSVKRYMMLSSGDGYVVKDVTGCLGFGRFFYGYADSEKFHLGSCTK